MGRRIAVLAVLLALLSSACARIERVSVGNDGEVATYGVINPPSIDDSGEVVSFETAGFLTPDDQAGVTDMYTRDRASGHTALTSVSPAGGQDGTGSGNGSISGDGRFVVYTTSSGGTLPLPAGSFGTNLYVKDRLSGALERVVAPGDGVHPNYSTGDAGLLDRDGRHLLFAWTRPVEPFVNAAWLQDRNTGALQPVSIGAAGDVVTALGRSISDDARYVLFTATRAAVFGNTTNSETQVFVRDVAAATTRLVSADASGVELPGSLDGKLSGNGRFAVLWQMGAPYHVFQKDISSGAVRQVDVRGCTAVSASTDYTTASISDDGQVIAFSSSSPDLAARDDNGASDVFLWRTAFPCAVKLISTGPLRRAANNESYWPAVSGDGRSVAFVSKATDLVRNDTNGSSDAFVWSTRHGAVSLSP